jgi:CheY-like chemotaxis protein
MNRTILMLEHDEDDRYITRKIFEENHPDISLAFVHNSFDLTKHLETCIVKETMLPLLILLDYHASPLSAVEILKKLKSDKRFNHIPVIVLSGTVHSDIIKDCYVHGASSFIQKPSASVETKISTFIRYWFEVVELI